MLWDMETFPGAAIASQLAQSLLENGPFGHQDRQKAIRLVPEWKTQNY